MIIPICRSVWLIQQTLTHLALCLQPNPHTSPQFSFLLEAMLSFAMEGGGMWSIQGAGPTPGWGCGHKSMRGSIAPFDITEGRIPALSFTVSTTMACNKSEGGRLYISAVLCWKLSVILHKIGPFITFSKTVGRRRSFYSIKDWERFPLGSSAPKKNKTGWVHF